MKNDPQPISIERQFADVIRLVRREALIGTAVFASMIGCFAIVIYSLQSKNVAEFASVFDVAIIVAGACIFVGGLIGFIFGIPRVLQRGPSGETAEAKQEESSEDQSKAWDVSPSTVLPIVTFRLRRLTVHATIHC